MLVNCIPGHVRQKHILLQIPLPLINIQHLPQLLLLRVVLVFSGLLGAGEQIWVLRLLVVFVEGAAVFREGVPHQ